MKPARTLPVLMYHHVSPAPGLVTVSPENFRAQMRWLARNGWRSVGAAGLEAFLAGHPLPAKSVMISFDDGYLDNWVHAEPVLRETGLKATIFLITGQIGDGKPRARADQPHAAFCADHRSCKELIARGEADRVMLRWSEVEAMRENGTAEFHSHTHRHRRFDREIVDQDERDAQLAADLAESRATLAARLGDVSGHLCWPQGYFDDAYRRVAAESGFSHLYTTKAGTNTPGRHADDIHRIVVKDKSSWWLGSRLFVYSHPRLARLYLGGRRI